MMRMVREFVEVESHIPLDRMIERLAEIRAELPEGASAVEVRTAGCDVFGRKLSITYLRPQTAEEIARDARYADVGLSIAA